MPAFSSALTRSARRLRPHDIEMPDRFGPLRHVRQGKARYVGQLVVVAGGHDAPPLVPFIELGQLDPQEGRLQFVEARVQALLQIHVLHAAAVVAQRAKRSASFGSSVVTAPPSPKAPIFLLGKKLCAPASPSEPAPPPAHPGALRLGHVLDHLQAVLGGQRHDCVHVGRLAVEMDRHDRLRARRERAPRCDRDRCSDRRASARPAPPWRRPPSPPARSRCRCSTAR